MGKVGSSAAPMAAFPHTARYEYRRVIGFGGMGAVFEAWDRELGLPVALKTIHSDGARALRRFKREFRTLAALRHPNLVRLHELVVDGEVAFFTMEIVDGVDFLAHARGEDRPTGDVRPPATETEADEEARATAAAAGETSPTADPQATLVDDGLAPPPGPPAAPALGLLPDRLLGLCRQLTEALAFLHAAGVVHRDIKPSNIRVRPDGHLVLLDFGIAADLGDGSSAEIIGTPAYRSPEQTTGAALTPAADWYSVGVMLQEALTSRRPAGPVPNAPVDATATPEPAAGATAGDALARLARALLAAEPTDRPDAAEVRQRLAELADDGTPALTAAAPSVPFVGRVDELGRLQEALRGVGAGGGRVALVRGPSGVGKTRLVRELLAWARPTCRVLTGRCYEQERIPFNALDSIVDGLAELVTAGLAARALTPAEARALGDLFPALRAATARAAAGQGAAAEPFEHRAHAFAGLRALLAAVAARAPLVLFIDDLHWADADSASLLRALLAPAGRPRLFLVASYRPDGLPTAGPLAGLLAELATDAVDVELLGLSADEAAALLNQLARVPVDPSWARALHGETGGNPFFLTELLRADGSAAGAPAGTALDDMVAGRVAGLAAPMRRLVELLAVAGEPLALEVAARAAGLGARAREQAVYDLVGARLARLSGRTRRDVALYHDRIREAVRARLPAGERRACHGALAQALEEQAAPPAEALFGHWQAAGEPRRAAPYARRAADEAAAQLAFERAAELYGEAVALGDFAPGEKSRILRARAEALVGAGHCAEAARVYLAARPGAPAAERSELSRLAVGFLLRSGHLAEGTALAQRMLAEHGIAWPRSSAAALAGIARTRLALRLRGLAWRPRRASAAELAAVDACWLVGTGLVYIDIVRGAHFQLRHLAGALAAGEPARIARGLGAEACYQAVLGPRRFARADRLQAEAERIAAPLGDRELELVLGICAGQIHYRQGRWGDAIAVLEPTERELRERRRGATWEIAVGQRYLLLATEYSGDGARLARLLPEFAASAARRADHFTSINFRSHRARLALFDDEPAHAAELLAGLLDAWGSDAIDLPRLQYNASRALLALYIGDRATLRAVTSALHGLRMPAVWRFPMTRAELLCASANCSLGYRAGVPARSAEAVELALGVRQAVFWLARSGLPWARAWARGCRGLLAAQGGLVGDAVADLADAAARLDACGLPHFAAAYRYQRGRLLGGADGAAERAAAEAALRRSGYRNPARASAMLAPGL